MHSNDFLGIKVDEQPIEKFFKRGFQNNPLWWKIPGPDGVYRYDNLAKYQASAPKMYIIDFSCHMFANKYGRWCRDNNDFPTHYSLIDNNSQGDDSIIAFWKFTNCRQCGKKLFVHSSTFIFYERMPVQKIFDGFFDERYDFNWQSLLKTPLIRDDEMFGTEKHHDYYGNINDHTMCCECLTANMRRENRRQFEEREKWKNTVVYKVWKAFFPEEAE
jgi:hypothetical protein